MLGRIYLLILEEAEFLLISHFDSVFARTVLHLLLPLHLLVGGPIHIRGLHQVVVTGLINH